MDGFHYSRKQLRHIAEDSTKQHGKGKHIQGGDDFPSSPVTFEDLLVRRGAPWTFNSKACAAMLTKAKTMKSGTLPFYSRT